MNDWTCTHGHRFATVYPNAPVQNTGPLSFHSFPYLMCYDPAQVQAVENTSNDYTVEPIWFVNLETLVPGFRTCPMKGRSITLVGFYYDETSKLMMVRRGRLDVCDSRVGALFQSFSSTRRKCHTSSHTPGPAQDRDDDRHRYDRANLLLAHLRGILGVTHAECVRQPGQFTGPAHRR